MAENYLQAHYNRFRREGGDHAVYVVANDIDDDRELCNELRENYERKATRKEKGL